MGEFGCIWAVPGGAGLCQGVGASGRGAGRCNGGVLWVLEVLGGVVVLGVLGLGPPVHMTALLPSLQRRRW